MVCPECGKERVVYNSCRDRHWPNCQSTPRDAWLLSRKEELIRRVYFSKPWVVYSVAPVCEVDKTLEYITRYSYRVAISNERIWSVDSQSVVFDYKDYRDGGKVKQTPISAHQEGCEQYFRIT